LEPRPEVEGYGRPGRLGRLGYETEVELWREVGDMLEDEADGEWLEGYDIVADGGVAPGVPLADWLVAALKGDGICAALTAAYGSTVGRVAYWGDWWRMSTGA